MSIIIIKKQCKAVTLKAQDQFRSVSRNEFYYTNKCDNAYEDHKKSLFGIISRY